MAKTYWVVRYRDTWHLHGATGSVGPKLYASRNKAIAYTIPYNYMKRRDEWLRDCVEVLEVGVYIV